MSFDIVQTPTLQAVATQDEKQLADHLQKRVDEAISQAEAEPGVERAIAAHGTAGQRLKRLQKAERVLNEYAPASREQMTACRPAVLDAIVESAASGGKPDFKKLHELAVLEDQNGYTSRAIQRVIEHLIPLAQIALLREESHAFDIESPGGGTHRAAARREGAGAFARRGERRSGAACRYVEGRGGRAAVVCGGVQAAGYAGGGKRGRSGNSYRKFREAASEW